MISIINYEAKEKLRIPLMHYIIADLINVWPKDSKISHLDIKNTTGCSNDYIEVILADLCFRGFVKVGTRSGVITSTPLWRQSTKVIKPEKETNPLVNVLRLATLEMRPDYYWTVMDAKFSVELGAKLENSFRETRKQDPTPEEVGNSFRILVQNLPAFWANKWDISKINTQYNSLILEIRENYGKSAREKIGIGSDHHRKALELLNEDPLED